MSVSREQRPISSRRTVSVPPSTPGRSDCVESCSCYTMRGSCYLRNGEERVLFSTTVLQRIQVAGSVTCMAFSSDESLIAVAVTYGAEHVVQLRYALMCGGPITGLCRGHAGHIHSVRFHENNQLLLTCSSDKMAKVWRRDGLFFAGNAHGPVDISCVCTLQHGFPLYGGVFFNGAIVTCGFDPRLFVWRYGGLDSSWTQSPGRDEVTARESNSIKEARCSSLGQVASTTLDASVEPRHYQGKVMQRAAGEAGGVFYSLSTQGYEYLWSVDSSGNVFIWSLSKQTARMDEDLPQIEVYRRYTCPGGTKVEVSGCTALVTCAKSPFAYVFDVIDHQLTHQVRVHQLPYPHAITLLPDGEAFVAPTADGHLQYWDSPCGSLCASPRDYDGVKVDMVTQGIVWSPILQIGVLVGSKGRMNAAGKKSHCPSTFVTVVGAPRDEKDMLRQSSLGVSSRFRSCCSGRGGSVDEVPDSTGVSVRCSPNTCSLSPSTRFSATEPSSATGGKASLMEEIIDTWRQLTCLHRRSKKGELMSTLDSATEVYVEENI
uniref:Uncharacterized protein TCIL3000_11_14550 n=1 Tax=Trypanosoma congolense (strain IL3000) TaxID=1068625 RepID=G0V2R6_TRYCI|nr:unnamed protein product [Trypanosoma congolense IL3000]